MDRASIVPRVIIQGARNLPQCLDRGLRPACVRHRRWRMSALGGRGDIELTCRTACFMNGCVALVAPGAICSIGASIGGQTQAKAAARMSAYGTSGDEYDREAITHVMACSSHFPGHLIRGFGD
jgi:hypothetical protein